MELHIKRRDLGAIMDFNHKGIISNRPLTEYIQYLNLQPGELRPLSNKQILLIGGGMSPVRSWLEAVNINAVVTNLDFYYEPDESVAHNHINEDFYKWIAPTDFYNEIWALHSLPLYSLNCLEVELFFAKSLLMLAPGGNLRVFPINDGNLDAVSHTKNFYGHAERARDAHKAMMDMGKMSFPTTAMKNDLVSIADQMEELRGDNSIYKCFYEMHQREPWNTFAQRRDFENAKLRGYLFHISAPMNKMKVNDGLVDYINAREPEAPKIEITRVEPPAKPDS